jgi:hypothetical protein
LDFARAPQGSRAFIWRVHGRNLPLQLLCRRSAGTILDVEASSTGKVAEVNATRTMIDRVEHTSR